MEAVSNKRRSPIIALYFLLPTINEKALKGMFLFGQLARYVYVLVVFLAFNCNNKKVS